MMGEVQLQVELGCSTLPLWWSPRARAPVSGYALEGLRYAGAVVPCLWLWLWIPALATATVVRWRVSWDVADAGYGCTWTSLNWLNWATRAPDWPPLAGRRLRCSPAGPCSRVAMGAP